MENYRVDPKLRGFVRKFEYLLWWLAWIMSMLVSLLIILLVAPMGDRGTVATAIIACIVWSFLICAGIPFVTGSTKFTGVQLLLSPLVPFLLTIPLLKLVSKAETESLSLPVMIMLALCIYLAGISQYFFVRLSQIELEMTEKLEAKLREVKGADLPANTFDLERSKRTNSLISQMETLSVIDGTDSILEFHSKSKNKLMKALLVFGLVPAVIALPLMLFFACR